MIAAQRASGRRAGLLTLLGIVFLLTRLVYLESDLPPWGTTLYSPIDEFYYTQLAFEMVHPTETLAGFDINRELVPTNLIETDLTAVSLKVIGNTYYGLRMPSVVAGLLAFLIFAAIYFQRFGPGTAMMGAALLFADPGFILSNRVAEPTIFRLAAAVGIAVWVMRQIAKRGSVNAIALGVVSTAGFLLVYPTNAFLLPAALFVSLAFPTADRWPLRVAKLIGGGIAATLAWALLLVALLPVGTMIDGFAYTFGLFSNRVAGGSTIHNVKLPFFVFNLATALLANFFRLNKYFFAVTGAAALVLTAAAVKMARRGFAEAWRGARVADRVMAIYAGSFVLQTLFINDFPQRKMVFALPFVIYFVLLACEAATAFFPKFPRARAVALAALAPAVLLAAATSYRLIYREPKYFYLGAMHRLNALNGEYVVGGWSLGFRLYNNYHTYLNWYQYDKAPRRRVIYDAHLAELAKLPRDIYVLDYDLPELKTYYERMGFAKVAKVMDTNDPTNIDAPVVLFKNVR